MAQYPANIDLSTLDGTTGFRLSGEATPFFSGWSVASAGDINRDGFADLIVGAPGTFAPAHVETAYVVFGKASGFAANIDLSTLDGATGFKLIGVAEGDVTGRSVAPAGDVNGDGFDDLIVGAPWADPQGEESGASYVVYGKSTAFAANLDLAALDGVTGFRLSGPANSNSGWTVTSGDVNGDSLTDLIIAAPRAMQDSRVYAVFGDAAGFAADVDLSTLDATAGFQIAAPEMFLNIPGQSVVMAFAGDFNGDGFGDLITGELFGTPPPPPISRTSAGLSHVMFGNASGSFDAGFTLYGEAAGDLSGFTVASAGDVNGDGLDDLIIGAFENDSAYVVFGRTAGFDSELSNLNGANGFQITGVSGDAAAAADINGDGFDDLIVGASSGVSYVLFGKASGFAAEIAVSSLDGNSGFKLTGAGHSVAPAGDVNGDGWVDLILGNPTASGSLGASYVVFGRPPDAAVNRVGSDAPQTILGGDFNDTLSGLGGDDILVGHGGDDTLDGGAGNDRLTGGAGADALTGGADSDTASYAGSGAAVTVDLTLAGAQISAGDASGDVLGGIENLIGTALADMLTGDGNDNTLEGGAGADTLTGALGSDTASYAASGAAVTVDLTVAGAQVSTGDASGDLLAGFENLTGSAFADTLIGDGGSNRLDGLGGADTMTGGAGDDVYGVDNAADTINENPGEGTDAVMARASYALPANVENLTLANPGHNSQATGNALANIITGNVRDNVLIGLAGADTLTGGGGTDTADYSASSAGVTVNLATNVNSGGDAAGDVLAEIENLTGSAFADTLTGDGGNNRLDGGAGADVMAGGAGDDIFLADNAGDLANENPGEGTDTVRSSVDFALSANVEDLELLGGAAMGTGNSLINHIVGNALDNVLDGLGGADVMRGGPGDDSYIVDDPFEDLAELEGEGLDTVYASASYHLVETWIENLYLLGVGDFSGIGNTLSNFIQGNTGNNTLDGSYGDDTIQGGAGADAISGSYDNDTIEGGAGADTISGGNGTDVATYATSGAAVTVNLATNVNSGGDAAGDVLTEIENLTGSVFADTLTGDGGNNRLDGLGGADSMAGGAGDDVYLVENAGDAVTENPGEGTDTIRSSIDLTLPTDTERLELLGSATTGNGNSLGNQIFGNALDNVLDGLGGADVMQGAAGNDSYFVDNIGDQIVEQAGQGTDTVSSGITFVLPAGVENLVMLGLGDTGGFGNALANTITGTAGIDVIDGGAGADAMLGGAADDAYFVDNAGDVVTENAAGGFDAIYASLSSTLPDNVEMLYLLGSGNFNATGNAFANRIEGNGGANTLDGGAGVDYLLGGAGNDTYVVDSSFDEILENAGGGVDTVNAGATYALSANIENLNLTGLADISGYGNGLTNFMTGNIGNNALDGGGGIDHLAGGGGNDSYFVDSSFDEIVEDPGDGNDVVYAGVSYALTANLETLLLSGAAVQGIGNGGVNTIIGTAGANSIDGGGAADYLAGGAGDDVYVVDSSFDRIAENAGEGNDVVYAGASYALAANLEALLLSGAAIQGVGNGEVNTIIGTAGANSIDGGGGADYLAGGAGDDTYVVDSSFDRIAENPGEGNDVVMAGASYALAANLEVLLLSGAAIQGIGNGEVNTIIGTAGNNGLDGGGGADYLAGGAGDDIYVVDSSFDRIAENPGEGNDVVYAGASYALAANLEGLLLSGAAIQGIGNGEVNTIIGTAGANSIDGGGGADVLTGNGGIDTFVFRIGESHGDVIRDFDGAGAASGDQLQFVGFGVGATLNQLTATIWQIDYNGGASHEQITFANAAAIHASDYIFL
jgi:Ca2+-binding RTX toxin-like protein